MGKTWRREKTYSPKKNKNSFRKNRDLNTLDLDNYTNGSNIRKIRPEEASDDRQQGPEDNKGDPR